jgi:hypothetical protein
MAGLQCDRKLLLDRFQEAEQERVDSPPHGVPKNARADGPS